MCLDAVGIAAGVGMMAEEIAGEEIAGVETGRERARLAAGV